MPSFDLMDKVELFVRKGTFPAGASKSSMKVTRAASKHFLYKDGCLWRSYRGRLLRVVRNDEEVREILTRYHDNNNHAGRARAVKEIMMMYYWVGVTEAVKTWIKACVVCQSRTPAQPPELPVRFCLAYGCDASSYVYPELSFHRFPKDAERRRRWLTVAQRDEGSLRSNSYLCSRHFEASSFSVSEEGQLTLSPEAVPTIVPVTVQQDEVAVPSDEDVLQSNSLEDFLSTAADHSETPVELQEHQYCLQAPDQDSMVVQTVREHKRRRTIIEPGFSVYSQIARYLSHRVLPVESKRSRFALKRMAKRFGLIDGVLMYTRVSPPVRVPRSREEVNSILKQFHDDQGHCGQALCQREITKQFYWASMTRDLACWISSCNTCLNRTKRKWLRCSVSNCTNCCGPVERGLGLTFHKFPLHNAALLTRWLKAVGRPNWHPRLRSSVCSTHFTEDCFDRSGEKVALHADAVPTPMVHSDSGSPSRRPAQPALGEEAFFAKYDAVELYLSTRTYPPGLSYVEKNTFRRFCKAFVIKDDELHMVRGGDRARLVLRSRQQVEAVLEDYHNELNHLDANKCLRLLKDRYFWKTMRSDVLQWIHSCSECSSKKRKNPETEPGGPESLLEVLSPPQSRDDEVRGQDDGDPDGDEERQSATGSEEKPLSSQLVTPISPQPRIPILLHLRTPINLQPRTPNAPFVVRLLSVSRATPQQSEIQKGTDGSDIQPESQSSLMVQVEAQPEEQTQPQDQKKTSGSQGGTRTPCCGISKPLTESCPPPEPPVKPSPVAIKKMEPSSQNRGLKTRSQSEAKRQTHIQHPERRKADLEAGSLTQRSSGCGLEPVVAQSTKPWPVFTIGDSDQAQTARRPSEGDKPAPFQRLRSLQARMVIQQCSQAKVKTKPAMDGADAQWAEIQEGIVVYVCFFHGAAEDVTHEMASRLMTVKLFRRENGRAVSVLDLPGSVLLIPQDSLAGEVVPKGRIQYKGRCERWRGAQLFSHLVSACRELMSCSVKCTEAGVKVERGVYRPQQEIHLNSLEPLTLLLEC
uniref:uncharacterized protein LOC124071484 isoform X2 n=1 Tax=Scatophagus argus TaxID=75038 RepID=UPI001ED839DB|nr:uncharacterized protein LOC124071484 isoform X2 [Scatophagus argus]